MQTEEKITFSFTEKATLTKQKLTAVRTNTYSIPGQTYTDVHVAIYNMIKD